MPLKVNESFTHKGEEDAIPKEIAKRADVYSNAIRSIQEIDLIFLKSCGYYETVIDEILQSIGYETRDLEKIGILAKIKTLRGIIPFQGLIESMEKYSKLTNARNSVAHTPSYRLENDNHFLSSILKLNPPYNILQIKNAMSLYFIDIYSAPLFIATGIKYNNTESQFLVFEHKD